MLTTTPAATRHSQHRFSYERDLEPSDGEQSAKPGPIPSFLTLRSPPIPRRSSRRQPSSSSITTQRLPRPELDTYRPNSRLPTSAPGNLVDFDFGEPTFDIPYLRPSDSQQDDIVINFPDPSPTTLRRRPHIRRPRSAVDARRFSFDPTPRRSSHQQSPSSPSSPETPTTIFRSHPSQSAPFAVKLVGGPLGAKCDGRVDAVRGRKMVDEPDLPPLRGKTPMSSRATVKSWAEPQHRSPTPPPIPARPLTSPSRPIPGRIYIPQAEPLSRHMTTSTTWSQASALPTGMPPSRAPTTRTRLSSHSSHHIRTRKLSLSVDVAVAPQKASDEELSNLFDTVDWKRFEEILERERMQGEDLDRRWSDDTLVGSLSLSNGDRDVRRQKEEEEEEAWKRMPIRSDTAKIGELLRERYDRTRPLVV